MVLISQYLDIMIVLNFDVRLSLSKSLPGPHLGVMSSIEFGSLYKTLGEGYIYEFAESKMTSLYHVPNESKLRMAIM